MFPKVCFFQWLTFSILVWTSSAASDNETWNPATLVWSTNSEKPIGVKFRLRECVKCHLIDVAQISNSKNQTIQLQTYYPEYFFTIVDLDTHQRLCTDFFSKPLVLDENGNYSVKVLVNSSNLTTCLVQRLSQPPTPLYLPLIIAAGVLPALGFSYVLGKLCFKRLMKSREYANNRIVNSELGIAASSYVNLVEDEIQTALARPQTRQSQRIKSVDVLRGLSLAIMIFVNSGSGGYSTLNHSVWNGLHLADLVFPCFIFIMGVAIPLSLRSMSAKSIDRVTGQRNLKMSQLLLKLTQRTALLFLFGLIISNSSGQYLSELRIFGVLQRFAVCYFVCTLIELLYFRLNNFTYVDFNIAANELEINWNGVSKWLLVKSKFKEIFLYPIQWLLVFILALVWALLTFLLPVEGCPTGYLGPGGLHQNATHFNCTGGSAGYIDRVVLGPKHLYQTPTSRLVYQSNLPYDPEGILGCLTSCVLTYLGVATGHILIHYQEPLKRIARLLLYAILWGSIALALCQLSWEDGWIPINKNLWSLSYILAMASMSLIAFSVLYLIVDVYDVYSGGPFVYLGRNSIVVYLGHEILADSFPLFRVPELHTYLLPLHIYWVSIWTIVAAIMDYKKVYINL